MSTEDLLAQAEERMTTSRIGKSYHRETDKDLVVIQKLAEEVRRLQKPQSEPVVETLEDRRLAAYRKMEELVYELTAILDEEEGEADQPMVPTGWCLAVGYDVLPENRSPGNDGATAMFPRDGRQAGWKTAGILSTLLARELDRQED